MHYLTRLFDAFLEYAKGTRVRDHEGGQLILVLLRFFLQVFQIERPISQRLDGDDLVPHHGGTGGVGTMCRERDQADVAMSLRLTLVIRLDDLQPRKFARRA